METEEVKQKKNAQKETNREKIHELNVLLAEYICKKKVINEDLKRFKQSKRCKGGLSNEEFETQLEELMSTQKDVCLKIDNIRASIKKIKPSRKNNVLSNENDSSTMNTSPDLMSIN